MALVYLYTELLCKTLHCKLVRCVLLYSAVLAGSRLFSSLVSYCK